MGELSQFQDIPLSLLSFLICEDFDGENAS